MKLNNNIILIIVTLLYFGGMAFGQGDVPETPAFPDELKETIDVYKAEREALRQELREAIAELGNPSKEEVRAVIIAFREENAERIAAQRKLGSEIRDIDREFRGNHPDRPGRPEKPAELVALQDEFRAKQDVLIQARKEFSESIKDLSKEDRHAAIQDFNNEQRLRHQEQKELRRQIRDQARDNLGSDRRPDDS